MIIPAAMFIESAVDMLKDGALTDEQREAQKKEFKFAIPDATDETVRGYELGLQVMRILLMGNQKAVEAGVTL